MFVTNLETYLFDPLFVSKTYLGETYPATNQIYVVFNRSYLHGNVIVSPLIFKPYGEFLTVLAGNHNFSEYAGAAISRAFLSAGLLLSKNIEFFGTIESGLIWMVWTSQSLNNEEWNNLIVELRQKTFYISVRRGVTWYYDNYSGLEVGYRIFLHGYDTPLRYIRGFTLTDWAYNYVSVINEYSERKINIPFITTDYYLSFSTKF
ncbi:MAG: hypothetical protein ACP5KD_02975 [Fervidobacterium sp.]